MISTLDEELICRILRGVPAAWPDPCDAECRSAFLHRARYHGVPVLLSAAVRSSAVANSWPLGVRQSLSREAAAQAAVEMVQAREIARVMQSLVQAEMAPLLMKGTPLAYTDYRAPHLRPRADTDLLIHPSERELAERVLAGLGYERVNATRGSLVSYEFAMTRVDRSGVTHVVDVHWRVSNRQVFADALSYDECMAGSEAVPQLGARALGPTHALLLACMHRVTHVTVAYDFGGVPHLGDRLIWLYDIHLLATRLGPAALQKFAELAESRRVRRLCLDGLALTQRHFGTSLPQDVMDTLAAPGPRELSAQYLEIGRMHCLVKDIQSLPNWRDRLRLSKEHVFPPADYMLEKYRVSRRAWLPALYLHRGVRGLWRLLRGE